MEFENLIGTTGVTTDVNNLYVANNKVISILDLYGHQTDIPHPYERVSGITMSPEALFGIYDNGENGTNGIFEMKLSSHTFREVPVNFNPVSIFYLDGSNDGIVIMDDMYHYYRCDNRLIIKLTDKVLPKELIPTKFMTFGMTKGMNTTYFSTNDKVIDMNTLKPLPLSVNGNILSIQYYLDFLFIIYVSDYNHYSILQYDPIKNKEIKTIEGGMISGPPLYSCIYQNYLVISASTNKMIPLNLFDIPLLINTTYIPLDIKPPDPYQLFDLLEFAPSYIDQSIDKPIDFKIDTLKTRHESLQVDTGPAEKGLFFSYLWLFLFLFIISIFLLLQVFQEDRSVHRVALFILVVSIPFIINSYI